MCVSFTNSSSRFNSSCVTIQNNTSAALSNQSFDPMQQFVQMQAAILVPPIAAALSNWTWSLLPSVVSLPNFNVMSNARVAATEVANQLMSTIGHVFSYLTPAKKSEEALALTPSCAMGLVAL